MVNVIINEIQRTLTVIYCGPYSKSGQEEQHDFSLENVDYFFEELNRRWILEEKMGVGEFEHKYIFSFPANDVYIQYIRE